MTPVVWIPGHLCGAWLFAPQLAHFAAGRATVIAENDCDDTVAAMAERLLAAAPGRFVLAGLSMGGMVAMEVIARAPDRVAGAVLLDTDPTPARAKEIAWRRALLADADEAGLGTYVEAFAGRFYLHSTAAAERLGGLTRQMMLETPVTVAHAQARALDARRQMAPLIAGFSGPVEVIVGAEDKVCPPLLHRPLADALPGAVLTEIPACGHLATIEAPGPVNARIAALLARAGSA